MSGLTDDEFERGNAFESISLLQSVEYDESMNYGFSGVEESRTIVKSFHETRFLSPYMLTFSHGINHAAVTTAPFLPSPSLAFCH